MDIAMFTEYLVKSICKDSDLVKVSSYSGEDKTVIEVLVPENSMGSVIGRDGRNAKAIRTIVNLYSYTHELGTIELNIDSF